MQDRSKETCYCCEAIANSREHIPPQCIFEKPRPTNLITVPSCDRHNSEKSKDDEYFRWFITSASSENKKAERLITTKVIKGFKRRPALLSKIWQGAIKNIPIYSEGGIYLGNRPGFKFDNKRIQNILNQICKGLFYYHFNKKFSNNYTFKDFVIYPKINDDLKKTFGSLKLYDIGDGSVFSYRFMVCSEDSNIILWFLMFFNYFLIICMSEHSEFIICK
ncbi:MAG: hypothetical protein AB1668_06695 [Nanoarchaeota archaeon]